MHFPRPWFCSDIFASTGSIISYKKQRDNKIAFRAQFADSKFYFNHWIKVHPCDLTAERLFSFYCRGAAFLFGNNQRGVDGVMPYLQGTTLSQEKIGVCMWQANDEMSDEVNISLFACMDPFVLGIFNDNDSPASGNSRPPLIRIVFALAAKKPSLQVVNVGTLKRARGTYTTYDIWCSGLSHEILCPIGAKEDTWAALLQASYGWEDVYKGEETATNLLRSMNPGVAVDEKHWSHWA